MKHHDVAIIGGGCVGLSTAKHLTELTDLDIAVFEKEHHLAEHQSGRNSGVLHPGFNYPPNSKKAQFATEGTRRMKQYCADHNIPCEEFGVLVVAKTDHEEEHLDVLASQAEANGVEYERLDSCAEIQEHEPHAVGQAALYAPEAASVDSQQYVYALAREIQQNDVSLYTGHAVERVRKKTSGYRLTTSNSEIDATHLVNAAGLHADTLAQQVGVGEDYQMIPFRGEYYEVTPDRVRCLPNHDLSDTGPGTAVFGSTLYTANGRKSDRRAKRRSRFRSRSIPKHGRRSVGTQGHSRI